jgi:hypothetical protein
MGGKQSRLTQLFDELAAPQQDTLLAFAEFLVARGESKGPPPLQAPLKIPRPEKESVVKAMQRLSATYPMLEKSELLNEATMLMSQHVMEGREAEAVIDELEELFGRYYEQYKGPEARQ